MSLLMDALKKAEQEKREAARRLEEATERTLGPDPDVNSAAETTGELETAAPEPAPHEPPFAAERHGLSLEPMGEPHAPGPSLDQPMPLEVLEAEEPTLEITVAVPNPLAESAAAVPPPPAPVPPKGEQASSPSPDATFHHGLPGQKDVPGLYEPTVQGEPLDTGDPFASYDETLPGVTAAQLARDIGPADQPTPAAAETVFAAARGPRGPSPALKWSMVGLTIVAVVAAGVGYYLTVTPMTPELPSPWVARGIESIPHGSAPPPAQPQTAALVDGTLPGTTIDPDVAVAEAGTEANTEAPPAPVDSSETQTAVAVAPPAAGAEADEIDAEAPALPPEEPSITGAAALDPAQPEASPPPIRITRSSAPAAHSRLLREAYDHFQSGDYASARLHYLAVLDDRPDNVDALLGMGAIAMKENDTARTSEYFSRVLQLDPRNTLATAALANFQRPNNPLSAESRLKNLIHASPDSAFLHFSLGNVYASQRRWPEAQQAFFDAYRNDPANPDYALNLAASLDRMGQRETALDYYHAALKLSGERPAGFDVAAVRERIEALAATSP